MLLTSFIILASISPQFFFISNTTPPTQITHYYATSGDSFLFSKYGCKKTNNIIPQVKQIYKNCGAVNITNHINNDYQYNCYELSQSFGPGTSIINICVNTSETSLISCIENKISNPIQCVPNDESMINCLSNNNELYTIFPNKCYGSFVVFLMVCGIVIGVICFVCCIGCMLKSGSGGGRGGVYVRVA